MNKTKKTNVKMEPESLELTTDQIFEIFTKHATYHTRPIAIITWEYQEVVNQLLSKKL